LFARWLQFAVFTPFLRNHSDHLSVRQEPWAFGVEVENLARHYLNLRYQLLPYLYGLVDEAARTGTPVMRPLLWHYPGDPVAVACSDQFLLGRHLLVAPILRQGAVARAVYLPRGEWFDFWTGTKFPGGIQVAAEAPLDRIPLFVQAGAILPLAQTRPFIGSREPDTILLHLWPDDHGRLAWYDDDGRTRAHEQGVWQRRDLTAFCTRRGGWLRIGAATGRSPGQTRTWRVLLRGIARPFRVTVQGKPTKAAFVAELGLAAFDIPAVPHAVEARWR
jgi:alpha-glucosidase